LAFFSVWIGMNDHRDIDQLLAGDTGDTGCAAGFEVLDEWVEEELSGGDPSRSMPGLAAHLRSCPACRLDYRGLLDAAERLGDADPSTA
jgi:hypothetical protein